MSPIHLRVIGPPGGRPRGDLNKTSLVTTQALFAAISVSAFTLWQGFENHGANSSFLATSLAFGQGSKGEPSSA